MESVKHSLEEVSQALQKLLQNSEQAQESPKGSPAAFISSNPSNISGLPEGYMGDSSFKAHVQRVTHALKDAAADLEFSMTDPNLSADMNATHIVQEASNSEETTPSTSCSHASSFKIQYPELQGRSLPPQGPVLKLLRLAQTEKQRFFIDVPIIDEHEFGELCQKVYFAFNDYSLSAWVIVNAGLFYLFIGLEEHNLSQVGLTPSDVQANLDLLSTNLEAAIQSLRLAQDPSIEACQALTLLASFCMKSGRSAMAWLLIASASRMCIDLGWHRLPRDLEGSDTPKKRSLFWHVYILDKGMAFTFGRTPSIHQYDVATERPSFKNLPPALGYLYAGFLEFAVIVGDMHIQLFSAAALRSSQRSRAESAKAFAARLLQVNEELKKSLLDDQGVDVMLQDANILLDIIMHCLMTIAYRIIPCDEPGSHPLQCNTDCIESSRQALSAIVHAGQTFGHRHPMRWNMFLNMLFSLVPFACFVVLAGNVVTSSSTDDLGLLSAAVSAVESIAGSSPSGKKLYDVCKSFYQLASLSVSRKTVVSSAPPGPIIPNQIFDQPAQWNFSVSLGNPGAPPHDHIMASQDWDALMNEFDLEIGAGAMASFVEPYIPFDGRLS
ncbi:hypothetical protein F5884DRAFT_382762 [Xylogone sp. PMI_703]|nr:hypothetical protein F5884DRAFT_382762 [Xylogone sp. PMI_703]